MSLHESPCFFLHFNRPKSPPYITEKRSKKPQRAPRPSSPLATPGSPFPAMRHKPFPAMKHKRHRNPVLEPLQPSMAKTLFFMVVLRSRRRPSDRHRPPFIAPSFHDGCFGKKGEWRAAAAARRERTPTPRKGSRPRFSCRFVLGSLCIPGRSSVGEAHDFPEVWQVGLPVHGEGAQELDDRAIIGVDLAALDEFP